MPTGRAVEVSAFGRVWKLPHAPALVWINSVRGEDNTFPYVFPGMVKRGDAWDMFDNWMTVEDADRRCANAARKALQYASGREWWWTHNLINEAVSSWNGVNGKLVRQGVRASDESLPDWLDAAFTLMSEVMSEDDRATFHGRLILPPKNIKIAQSNASTRAALMAFAAF
jgi:hypothetical protein